VNDPCTASGHVARLCGEKHAAVLQKHLRHLRGAYGHGNRTLFYDEVVGAYLLAFFNPTMRSLRAIEDASRTPEAAEHLHLRRLCRSTMSDANALMDARLLEPLIRQLRARLPELKRRDGQLARLLEQVQLIDGSFFASAATVTWALRDRKPRPARDGERAPGPGPGPGAAPGSAPGSAPGPAPDARQHSKARLDLRLDGHTLLPVRTTVSGKGQSEPARAREAIEPGVIYVADRGFENLTYVAALLDGNADFVLRVKATTPTFEPRESLPLDEADYQAGVLGDRIGRLVGSPHTAAAARRIGGQPLREVIVFDPRNPKGPEGPEGPERPIRPIRLITSLLDVPAHVIAELYRWRWQIELFFRWLKVHAHFEHLISRSRNGMTMGFHVAVIAVLLIYLRTGRPMSRYAFNLLSLVAAGFTTLEGILPILERRERECQRERERKAAKRASKTSV
jgi:hypothetical protein